MKNTNEALTKKKKVMGNAFWVLNLVLIRRFQRGHPFSLGSFIE